MRHFTARQEQRGQTALTVVQDNRQKLLLAILQQSSVVCL